MKKEIVLICLATLFLGLFFVTAFESSSIGNPASDINSRYGSGENLTGWINISLINEPFNSPLSTFYTPNYPISSIAIFDLIKKNKNIKYNCSTIECGMTYISMETGSDNLEFLLNAGESKVVGFKITEEFFNSVSNLRFTVSSNAYPDCLPQLKIDVGADENIDWSNENPSYAEDFCHETYGCYNPSLLTTLISLNTEYCQDINISSASRLFVGADITRVSGTGNANFRFRADDQSCIVSASSTGRIGCWINKSINEETTINLCISQTSGTANSFSLFRESTAPVCGSDNNDFSIFIKTNSYGVVGEKIINSSNIVNAANSYLNTYNGDCSRDCYLPIKFHSNQDNQKIIVNNSLLIYNSGASGIIIGSTSKLHNLNSSPSLISMPFTKLFINNSGLIAPDSGNYNLSLKLNNNTITTKQVEVVSLPIIGELIPIEAPAVLDTDFSISFSGNVTKYYWNFGDNSSLVETSVNRVVHRYSSLGRYNLVVTAENSYGSKSKSFSINVVSPGIYLNGSLSMYKERVNTLKSQISSFPEIVKTGIENKLNLSDAELKIASLQIEYNSAGNNSQKYIDIANSLQAINLPDKIGATEKSSGKFLFKIDSINPNDIKNITGEDSSASDDKIKNAVASWAEDSLDMSANLNVYSAFYGNRSSPLNSHISLQFTPKTSLGDVYLVINAKSSDLIFQNSLNPIFSEDYTWMLLDLSSEKTVDFLISERISFVNIPIYLTPSLSELKVLSELGPCNFNSICESGENTRNCRNDCKPIGSIILWLFILIIFIFVIYIALQEWYKKNYETKLFRDKNDLYNLTSFIANAENQGISKNEVFSKLKEKNWSNEQIDYAYKKYLGKRTGMWEIPIFRFFEKKKILKEIAIRKNNNNTLPPKPVRNYTGPNKQ
jgi:hypothetical protein